MKKLFYSVIILTTAFIHNSCNYNSSCDPYDCKASSWGQILINFNLDSLNGGYKMAELKNVQIIYSTEQKTDSLSPYNGIFYIWTGYNYPRYKSVNILDKTTGNKHTLNNFTYYQENPECSCNENEIIGNFKYDGSSIDISSPGAPSPYIILINK